MQLSKFIKAHKTKSPNFRNGLKVSFLPMYKFLLAGPPPPKERTARKFLKKQQNPNKIPSRRKKKHLKTNTIPSRRDKKKHLNK